MTDRTDLADLFEPIAVVGICGRFPGAPDAATYWRNLREGRETLTDLSDEDLLAAGVSPALVADPSYVRRAGLVPGADLFDAGFFRMTPREAEMCDPQLRLFLEVVHGALEDAGCDPDELDRQIGVFGACGPTEYGTQNVLASTRYSVAPDMGINVLNNIDYLATLASYKLDLKGPSMSVQTACSSSLSAVHAACRALQNGECDAALAAASKVSIPYRVGYRWSPGSVHSADGHLRAFDAAASGTIFTSGAAAVLLKRLDEAISDGDHVWGVIHGIGMTNDGSDKVSFSAPSAAGQVAAVVDAMSMAGFHPREMGYVEMHATGTPLGDPIEVGALARAYRRLSAEPLESGIVPVGSVKSNIGHTDQVGGMAGLLKLLLALEHEELPPTIHVRTPNPKLEIDSTPFRFDREARDWRRGDAPRRAGLTSLGIGGTNVHLVLEEGPATVPSAPEERPRVVVWSGRDPAARSANREALASWFAQSGADSFADATATLQRGRTAHPARAAVVCRTAAEAAAALSSDEAAFTGELAGADPRRVVMTFPGQGSQHAAMAAGLYGRLRVFTETVDVCLDAFARHGAELASLWPGTDGAEHLDRTEHAQPALFMVEYALARQWMDWGVVPSVVLGHSVGELVAATVAGVLFPEDAMRLVAARGRAMQRRPGGSMRVVGASPEIVARHVPAGVAVAVAAVNADDQTVLSGSDEDLLDVLASLEAADIPSTALRTSHAFHGPGMQPAADELLEAFADVTLAAPTLPMVSAATGRRLTDEQACDPTFWARQVAEPVLYADALATVTADADDGVLLEVGPGTALTGLARRHRAVTSGGWRALASLPRPGGRPGSEPVDDERAVLDAVAGLWVAGAAVDWSQISLGEGLQRVSMPGYQFQRQRHWVDPDPVPAGSSSTPSPDAPAEPPEARPAGSGQGREQGMFTVPGWTEAPRPAGRDPQAGRPPALVLVPAERDVAAAVVSALQLAGRTVLRVRAADAPNGSGADLAVRVDHLAEDLEPIIEELARRGQEPGLLVHAWAAGPSPSTDDPSAELDSTVLALLDLVQGAGRRSVAGRLPGVLVLTRDAVDVSGGEPVAPARSALVAAARTYALETPGSLCRVVDLGREWDEDELARELMSGAVDPVVALRRTRRWLPVQRPWSPEPGGRPLLRKAGVYVVTGGTGGLGLAVARRLAATGLRPRLALLGRTRRDIADDVTAVEASGAEVRVVQCDVADEGALSAALDHVASELGPITGVLHLAGVPGDGMLQFRDRESVRAVLAPKVQGTVALARALEARPATDFVVAFSSRAAITGMVGGGDYAAANAFLDAFAADRPGWRSIAWPAWSTVGMARGGVVDEVTAALRAARDPGSAPVFGTHARVDAGPAAYETVISAGTHWELDEHRIGGAAIMPGTGQIDLVLRAFLDTVPKASGPVTLRDVVFLRPLVGDRPQHVRVCLDPLEDAEAWHVRLLSRDDAGEVGEPGPWRENTTGTLTRGGPDPVDVPVAELTAGLVDVPPMSERQGPDSAYLFGPRWQNTEQMSVSPEVVVARLALPAAFAAEAEDYVVHPALLDTAVGAHRDFARDGLAVPFMYRSMTWYRPLPAEVFSRATLREGDPTTDLEVTDTEGRLVLRIDGFRARPAPLGEFGTDLGDAADPGGVAQVADPVDADPARHGADDLAPEDGVELLMELLTSVRPSQVAVVPPGERGARTVAEPAAPASSTLPAAPTPAPRDDDVTGSGAVGAPGPATVEARLAALWQEVLGYPTIDPDDDFFDLGGDSLMAVALTGRVRDAFGVELSIGSLFDAPTPASLASVLQERGAT